jgi:hypothetical protein
MWWTISVLVIVILFLIAYVLINQVVGYRKIGDLLSIIATVLSILLSIFAIIYSYITAVETTRQWSDISGAVKEIKEANSSTRSSIQMMLAVMTNIHGKVSAIDARQSGSPKQEQSSIDIKQFEEYVNNHPMDEGTEPSADKR